MEHKGTVYFFTGLSGAGKTTVGSLFYRRLKNTKPNAVYLDGDEIRVAFGEDVGYTNDERLRWAGRIFRVCKLLSDQGIDVVCCSIAMYQSVRAWNRANIPNYKEIYLRVKPETLLARNQKGLYTGGHNVVGVDLPFDEPQTPDLIIQNDGERTPLEAVEEIERVLYPNIVENPIDNRDYWNRYYQDGLCPMDPSPFARYAATLVEPGRTLVDLGCGNGRDALYFASLGLSVIAIDLSDTAIQTLRERGGDNPRFLCGDLSTPPSTGLPAMTMRTAALPSTPSTSSRSGCCCWPCTARSSPAESFSSRCGASMIRCTAGDSPRRKTRSSTTIITDASSSWRS